MLRWRRREGGRGCFLVDLLLSCLSRPSRVSSAPSTLHLSSISSSCPSPPVSCPNHKLKAPRSAPKPPVTYNYVHVVDPNLPLFLHTVIGACEFKSMHLDSRAVRIVPVSLPPLNHLRLRLDSTASFRHCSSGTCFPSRPVFCQHIYAAQPPLRPLATSQGLLCSRRRVDVARSKYCLHADSGGMHAYIA
jgi:hypothetical protein